MLDQKKGNLEKPSLDGSRGENFQGTAEKPSLPKEENSSSFWRSRKLLIPVLALGLIFFGWASFWGFNKLFLKPAPADLLPKNTLFYAFISLDPESEQINKLGNLAEKFPLYEEIRTVFDDWERKFLKQYLGEEREPLIPEISGGDLVMASINRSETEGQLDPGLVIMYRNEDKEAAEKIFSSLKEEKGLEITEEEYKGRDIYTARSKKTGVSSSQSQLGDLKILYFTYLDGYFVGAEKAVEIRKIIDVSKNDLASLSSDKGYQKIIDQLPKDSLIYGCFSSGSQSLDASYNLSKYFASLMKNADLRAALSSLFTSGRKEASLIKSGFAVWAEEDRLISEVYAYQPGHILSQEPSFAKEKSLAYLLPEKVNGRYIDFYREDINLKELFLSLEENKNFSIIYFLVSRKEMLSIDQKTSPYDEFNIFLGLDLEKDLIPFANKNYALFVAPSFIREKPEIGFIAEVTSPGKVEENLSQMKLNFEDFLAFGFFDKHSFEEALIKPIPFVREAYQEINIYSPDLSVPTSSSFFASYPGELMLFSFALKDDKLIVSSTKKGVEDIISSLNNPSLVKAADNIYFKEQLDNLPGEVQSFNYSYFYGIWGVVEYIFSETIQTMSEMFAVSTEGQGENDELMNLFEDLASPFLKTVKSSLGYAISEGDLQKSRQALLIEELSEAEKRKSKEALEKIKGEILGVLPSSAPIQGQLSSGQTDQGQSLTGDIGEKSEIAEVYDRYLEAEVNCDIETANSLIAERSKEIVNFTCSNMASEARCYLGRSYQIKVKENQAVLYLAPFSFQKENPFFFTKENGKWKLDFYRMAYGMAMSGNGCDSGWVWTNPALQEEFCGYFSEEVCPDPSY